MKKLWRKIKRALFQDEAAVLRWTRGLLLAVGTSLIGAAAALTGNGRFVALLLGGLLSGIGGLVSVGEPKPAAAPPPGGESKQ
jgi:hypothetical protein